MEQSASQYTISFAAGSQIAIGQECYRHILQGKPCIEQDVGLEYLQDPTLLFMTYLLLPS